MFKLFSEMVFCTKCVLSEDYESVKINQETHDCNYCRNLEPIHFLGKQSLIEKINFKHGEKIGVTTSGGSDSLFVLHELVQLYGAKNIVAFNHFKKDLVHPIATSNICNAVDRLGCDLEIVEDKIFIENFKKSLFQFLHKPVSPMLSVLICNGCRTGITEALIRRGVNSHKIYKYIHGASYLEDAPHKEALRKKLGYPDGQLGVEQVLNENEGYPFTSLEAWNDIKLGNSFVKETLKEKYPNLLYLGYFSFFPCNPKMQKKLLREKYKWNEPEDDFHFDCSIQPFKELLSFGLLGYTEYDFHLSEQIRHGLISRKVVFKMLEDSKLSICNSLEIILSKMKELNINNETQNKMKEFYENYIYPRFKKIIR